MHEYADDHILATEFCRDYCNPNLKLRYSLGCNIYTSSVIRQLPLAGVIDDYTDNTYFDGIPIVRSRSVSKNSLVLNSAGGRPLTAKANLDRLGLRNLDYFSFYKNSGLVLTDIRFNEGFADEYKANRCEYDWVAGIIDEKLSLEIFDKLVNFRSTLNIRLLDGFYSHEESQYFEDFLNLNESGEVFYDVGCFDGLTSLNFCERYPRYRAVYAFEPNPLNYQVCVRALSALRDLEIRHAAVSDLNGSAMISLEGFRSRVSRTGETAIPTVRLDDFTGAPPTLLKMDIEGGEVKALLGARQTILTHHPRLAICVYHNVGDFHLIPRLVLSIRDDYDLLIRHYTESIYETVMYFVPRQVD